MKYSILLLLVMLSCSAQNPEKKSIMETIGKELKLNMFKTVFYKGDTVLLESMINKYKYKSIVYLLDDCSPCYDKYIRWHKETVEIDISDNYTIIFIISGKYADEFLTEVDSIEHVEEKFFLVMDPNFTYPDGNTEIPKWILEQSILIDKNNKIRMVGSPFVNSKKLERFKEIIEEK